MQKEYTAAIQAVEAWKADVLENKKTADGRRLALGLRLIVADHDACKDCHHHL